MRIGPGDRKYATWPVAGLPEASNPVQVRFDFGPWLNTEFVVDEGQKVGVRILVAGPDADPTGAVVLALGSHTVQMKLEDFPEIDMVVTVEGIDVGVDDMLLGETFGATVPEVVSLAPHISVSELPALPADTVFGGSSQKVRTEDVQRWIAQVGAMVDARLMARASLPEAARKSLEAAARSVVVNGAAAYLVAAAFPMKAGVNDQTSYSAELESRYREGLASLGSLLDTWLTPDSPGGGPIVIGGAGQISGEFPPPTFLDAFRW